MSLRDVHALAITGIAPAIGVMSRAIGATSLAIGAMSRAIGATALALGTWLDPPVLTLGIR